ncbi:MAG: ABC transporter ATP-binding protein [Acidimicrobiia bacterium]|nr:ABC transporter ATP-binding protein [Acidimicrobiia bacterium]
MAGVTFDRVTKCFGDVVAVDDLSLDVFDEEFLVLLGPSGCGKSTALRMIAGLEEPSEGTIEIGESIVNDVEAKDRDVAMVFQSYALYPHMSVRKNIEFPLRTRKVASDEREKLVHDAAESLGLETLLDRKPAQLSGGQRQRVALARAIVRRPKVFLMDEPLSNLDAKLRVQTRAELIELQRELATTVIYVTHDQVEGMTMGHRIAIMADGKLQQVGPPQAVYDHPANLFVAGFIGNPPMNTVSGPIVRTASDPAGSFGIGVEGTVIPLPAGHCAAIERSGAKTVVLGVRPEHLRPATEGGLVATVAVIESLGHERHVDCRLADGQMVISRLSSSEPAPLVGERVNLTVDPLELHIFDGVTEEAIETT